MISADFGIDTTDMTDTAEILLISMLHLMEIVAFNRDTDHSLKVNDQESSR